MTNDEPICNCPLCGRTHRKMPFGKPPAAISDVVTIPRAQYEALWAAMLALDQCVDDFGETGHCVCPAAKEQAIEALAALRAAGIHETEGGGSER